MFDALPRRVTVYEVGPRDGLQNEAVSVPASGKGALLTALADAGLSRIEATSFVSPRWIPNLADADEVAARLPRRPGLRFSALVPNERGFTRARAAGLEEIAVFVSSSETHSRKNINRSVAEALKGFERICELAVPAGIPVRAYVSTVWGCPFEGDVPVEKTLAIARDLLAMGCYEVSLGDTIGVGTPLQTQRILDRLLATLPRERLALHLHDTRGTALANALVGLAMGIATLDAAVGGLGGCPYAPGAAGNLATEDLVYMLHGMGIETGVDLEKLVEAGELAQRLVGRKLPGKYLKAALGERAKGKRSSPGQT
jgi:hydroxymethylglutaryl-CoA lyase